MYSPNETKNHPPFNKRDNNGVERTSTTAVTLFPRLVYSDLNQSGLSQRLRTRVSHSEHLPVCVVLCALSCFCFLFCKCFGIPNSPRSLDLDDRQGLIASSAMQ